MSEFCMKTLFSAQIKLLQCQYGFCVACAEDLRSTQSDRAGALAHKSPKTSRVGAQKILLSANSALETRSKLEKSTVDVL